MKTASIRELKHQTTTVLAWVAAGQPVEVQRHGKPVALLSAPKRRRTGPARPDFAARLRSIYGDTVLSRTGTELVREDRGER